MKCYYIYGVKPKHQTNENTNINVISRPDACFRRM